MVSREYWKGDKKLRWLLYGLIVRRVPLVTSASSELVWPGKLTVIDEADGTSGGQTLPCKSEYN